MSVLHTGEQLFCTQLPDHAMLDEEDNDAADEDDNQKDQSPGNDAVTNHPEGGPILFHSYPSRPSRKSCSLLYSISDFASSRFA